MAYTAIPPVTSGGGGGTISVSPPLSGDGSGGSPVTIPAGSLSLGLLATQATQTVLGNGSGGAASPVALSIAGATSGLVATATLLNNTLTNGKTGGQTVIGGTAASEGITVTSTANATKGAITFGSANGMVFNENIPHTSVTTPMFTVGTPVTWVGGIASITGSRAGALSVWLSNNSTSPAATCDISAGNNVVGNYPFMQMQQTGTFFTPTGVIIADSGGIFHRGNTGNFIIGKWGAAGDMVFTTTASYTERARITNIGSMSIGTGVTTTAQDGFLYVPSCAGVPTGVPTTLASGAVIPLVVDRSANKAYIYSGGAWVALN